jgi:uncharacterized protein YdcH (DUF465 family)
MPDRDDQVRAILVKESSEYRVLLEEHQGHESRLDALNGKVFLSDQEKTETRRLKKEKLRLKDRMAAIAREYLTRRPDAAGQ